MNSEPRRERFKLRGMHCAACAASIERAVGALPGVVLAQVNFATETLTVTMTDGIRPEAISAAVAAAGYGATPVGAQGRPQAVNLRIGGMHCASCVDTITRALEAIPGVARAQVNLANNSARVEIEPRLDPRKLIEAVRSAGYTAIEASAEAAGSELDRVEARRNLGWVIFSAIAAVAVMYLQDLPGATARLGVLALASIVMFSAGLTFYRGAYIAARNRTASMDTLVVLGISAAYLYSVLTTFPSTFFEGPRFFDTAVELIAFIRLGKYLEARARGRAVAALRALLELAPDRATVIRDGREMTVAASAVAVGELVRVRPGERVPVDGIIVEGSGALDESMLTGESMPVEKSAGQEVSGGTLNTAAPIVIRATRVGSDTAVAQIVRLVEEAQADKAPIQRLADYVAARFVPAVIAIAAATLAIWLWLGPSGVAALTATVAVLVIACPCALGLATPTAIMVGSAIGLRCGILFKRASALELITRLQALLFDKTGTLTRGKPELGRIVAFGTDSRRALEFAAAAAFGSNHPLSRAVLAYAEGQGVAPAPAEHHQELAGLGVICELEGKPLVLGNERLLTRWQIAIPDEVRTQAAAMAAGGATPLYLVAGETVCAVLGFVDPIKPEAAAALDAVRARGIRTVMLSGDNRVVAEAVAKRLPIDEFHAELMPEDKIALLRRFQGSGALTGMVGDGINDAPALAAADIGIAIGSGTDVAKETGDLVLTRDDLYDVVLALDLGRMTLRKVRQNLFWAFFYNVIGIPIAAGVLYPSFGILLNPALAGLAMALSSVSVVGNALTLGFYRRKLLAERERRAQSRPLDAAAPAALHTVIEQRAAPHPHQSQEKSAMDQKLECARCGHEAPMPRHCNRAMHVEQIDGKPQLVCWMGPECGTAEVPTHCGESMRQSATVG